MLRFRDVCGRIVPALFACAVVLYMFVVVRGSESPAQTFWLFCGIVVVFGSCTAIAVIGRRIVLAILSGVFAALGFPVMFWVAYIWEALTH